MDRVVKSAQKLKDACRKSDTDWSATSAAILELARAVESLDEYDHGEAIKDHLVPLTEDLNDLLRSIRSKLVADVCEQLGRVVKTTRLAFTPLANGLLEALASTAKASSVAIRNPGFQLFSDISEYARFNLQTVHRVYRNSPQERVKTLLLEQMQIVLTYWPKEDVKPYYDDMVEVMRRGMREPSTHVRTASRQTFCVFSDIWQEYIDELVEVPTPPARDLLVKEKPYAAITKAIRKKFNIAPAKDNRPDSASAAIRQRRAALRRQGSVDGDDSIFVEVKESPRRSTKRAPSPGRAPVRVASPSSASRGTSSGGQAASPGGAPRSNSPGGTTSRIPSPSGIRPPSTNSTTATSSSPGRGYHNASPPTSGRAAISPPAQVRKSEYDHFLNLTTLGEHARSNGRSVDHPAAFHKSQKRVSIFEPPKQGADQMTLYPLQHEGPRNDGSDFGYLPTARPLSEPGQEFTRPSSVPSSHESERFQSGFAAAAQAFVSNDQARSPPYTSLQAITTIDSLAPSDRPCNGIVDHQRKIGDANSSSHVRQRLDFDDSFVVDSFLDRPIPSSAPAPEPRASANVTQRDRRRTIESSQLEENKPTVAITAPVPSSHVPKPQVESETPHCAFQLAASEDESVPPPPSVSISSAFLRNDMSSPRGESKSTSNDPSMPNSAEDEEDPPEEGSNKENEASLNIRQPEIGQASVAGAGSGKPDALANLNTLRSGLKTLRETPSSCEYVPSTKPNLIVPARIPSEPTGSHPAPSSAVPCPSAAAPQVVSPPQAPSDARVHQETISEPKRQQQQTSGEGAASHQKPHPTVESPPGEKVAIGLAREEHTPLLRPSVAQAARTTQAQTGHDVTFHQRPVPPKPGVDFVRGPTPYRFQPPPRPTASTRQKPQQAPQPRVQPEIRNLHPTTSSTTKTGQPVNDHAKPPTSEPRAQAPTRSIFSDARQPKENGHDSVPRQFPSAPQPTAQQFMDDAESSLRQRRTQHDHLSAQPSVGAEVESSSVRRPALLTPKPERVQIGMASKMMYSFFLVLGAIFGISGLIQAATKVRTAYEYHQALLNRINEFETSIVESYDSVRKMDEKYAIWSEYVRELTAQDESNALHQLESIQHEVEKWQVEMKNDLLDFKRSLSGDIIDAALAPLRDSNVTTTETAAPTV